MINLHGLKVSFVSIHQCFSVSYPHSPCIRTMPRSTVLLSGYRHMLTASAPAAIFTLLLEGSRCIPRSQPRPIPSAAQHRHALQNTAHKQQPSKRQPETSSMILSVCTCACRTASFGLGSSLLPVSVRQQSLKRIALQRHILLPRLRPAKPGSAQAHSHTQAGPVARQCSRAQSAGQGAPSLCRMGTARV
jgi:hypothetical protein